MMKSEVFAVQRGKFIVFEGIDGCGKSTQLNRLAEMLAQMGRNVVTTAEPTNGETGKALRRFLSGAEQHTPAELTALFVLDRLEHNREIEMLLAEGKDVVCDRYYYSTLAYQGSVCDYAWVKHMNCACPDIRRPDLCIFLDLTPEAALARIGARGEAREVFETVETLTKVRDTFLSVLADLDDRSAIIDAAGTPDEVALRVAEAVRAIL